jgi:hypothetical protein
VRPCEAKTSTSLKLRLTTFALVRYGIYEVGYKKWIALDHVKAAPGSAPPPALPFALHPNFITSLIGICTIAILLPVFPILHFAGLEELESPWHFAVGRPTTEGTPLGLTLAVAACGSLGVLYNGAFMICLSLWGPVVGVSLVISPYCLGQDLIPLPLPSLSREPSDHHPHRHLGRHHPLV